MLFRKVIFFNQLISRSINQFVFVKNKITFNIKLRSMMSPHVKVYQGHCVLSYK